MGVAEIEELARARGIDLDELAEVPRRLPEPRHSHLSAREQDVLAGMGVGAVGEESAAPADRAAHPPARTLQGGRMTQGLPDVPVVMPDLEVEHVVALATTRPLLRIHDLDGPYGREHHEPRWFGPHPD